MTRKLSPANLPSTTQRSDHCYATHEFAYLRHDKAIGARSMFGRILVATRDFRAGGAASERERHLVADAESRGIVDDRAIGRRDDGIAAFEHLLRIQVRETALDGVKTRPRALEVNRRGARHRDAQRR